MKTINLRDFNKQAKPTDDFFEFANGGWIKNNPIPTTETRWGSFISLYDHNRKALNGILKEVIKRKTESGSDEEKVGDFFFSAMNTKQINHAGLEPLQAELKKIDDIKTIENLFEVLAHLHLLQVGSFWLLGIEPDDKNSEKMIVRLYQRGLGLPDRDYYTRTDPQSLDIKEKYLQHIRELLKLMKYKNKEKEAEKILALETRLAHASMTNVEQRDVHKNYNKYPLVKIKQLASHIPWGVYLKNLGIHNLKELIISQPNFIKEINTVLESAHLDDLKLYLKFHLVNNYAGYLSQPFEKEAFWFYEVILNGAKKQRPRWQRIVSMVDDSLPDALGQLYVQKYFPPEAKQRMMKLIENIKESFRNRIQNLDWMSTVTKEKALNKLNAVIYKIGYPDKWRDYSKLEITRDSLAQNVMNATIFESKYRISKLGKPVDRTEWFMSAPTANAYYNPNMNEIVFPAGILQPPFFYRLGDDGVNYGAIGAIIGHELTHGFDDQGSHFDYKGNLRNWWTKEDRERFEKESGVLVKQYDEYVALDNLHVNGKLTLGENIADLGGLIIGYEALKLALKDQKVKKIDGLTLEQRYFIGFAHAECMVYRPEALRQRVLTDPHSPPRVRVNGPLSNMAEFYEAFGCKEGDALYRPEKERVKIW